MSLLQVDHLSVRLGTKNLVEGVSFSLDRGQTLGIVGESGSGKSLTALSLMGLLPKEMQQSGDIHFDGQRLDPSDEAAMQRLRGRKIGMVFQEPMSALNPLKTIGEQVAESVRWHWGESRAEAEARAITMLDRVGLPPAKFPLSRYPHQLSGGQRQRVVIAIACILKPALLIADEPTTALDVVLQAQILDLLADLTDEHKMGLILISHDLGVMAQMADKMLVMRHGQRVELGHLPQIFSPNAAPYTKELVAAHRIAAKPATQIKGRDTTLLAVNNLAKHYAGKRLGLFKQGPVFKAVDDVSFEIKQGQTMALVGQSGCGKSTLARCILGLETWQEGTIEIDGTKLDLLNKTTLPTNRAKMNIVFQDPFGSFDPRLKVEQLVSEPLHLLGSLSAADKRTRVLKALDMVEMPASAIDRYPHQFSGGQRQRIAIARAIITTPKLIIADEPVSALDVSIRATILALFNRLSQELGLACLFITHDLNVARAVAETILVMDQGQIVERGATGTLLDAPQSAAAKALVASAPDLAKALAKRGIKLEQNP